MTTVAETRAADQPGILIQRSESEEHEKEGESEENMKKSCVMRTKSKQQERTIDDAAQRPGDVWYKK